MGRRAEHAAGTSCPSMVTWHCFLPSPCLPHSPAESMIRALASDSRLWDTSVNVGSSVWVRSFLCSHLAPQGDLVAFCWDLPSFETLFSTPWHQP